MTGTSQDLELELRRLVVGTNDQRRRVGQTLFHYYRTLLFWRDKGLDFARVTQAWCAGGAAIFDAMAATLRELGEPETDEPLRGFLVGFLGQLADDLERGDHMLVSFVRWLEARFPEVTQMMQRESADSRIYDVELADVLAVMFAHCTRAERDEVPELLRSAAREIGRGLQPAP